MRKVLLDTHALLWASSDSARLSKPAKNAMLRAYSEAGLYLSMASVWEIGIKLSLGRLELPMGISAFLSEATAKLGVQLLPVSVRHVEFLVRLPWHHKDPFDRLLLAQAKVEELALVSADGAFDRYGVRRIW